MPAPRAKAFAVVGIGCRFPGGASTPAAFWQLLRDGVDAVTEIPRERFDLEELFDADPGTPGRLYSRWGGFVDGIDRFDADFFAISPREAKRMDPQHRMLLEVAWEALEDGGQVPGHLAGSRTGVFIGTATHDYGDLQVSPARRHLIDAHSSLGIATSIAAHRISYHLDLRGPSFVVDTACSSSLLAVHLACQSLAAGESELALAGGVNVFLTPEPAIGFSQASMLSPGGRCKAFDARADGFVRAEGAGVVVLKPLARALEDGDPIHAVVRGSAANQDGRTVGIRVPGSEAQQSMLRDALDDAGLSPQDISYMEAHGTGTAVGDPIEAEAIGTVIGAGRPAGAPCVLGSVKTNLGHLEAAAGIAGLIKAALALEHREIPPHLHLQKVNPKIPLADLGLRIPTALEPWPETDGPARAGVNSFGFGGGNAHVLLEEPPRRAPREPPPPRAELLTLSGRTPEARTALAARYRDQLGDDPSLALTDVCATAALRRTHHEHRLAVAARHRDECLAQLDAAIAGEAAAGVAVGTAADPPLAFVFSGMGPLWWAMGRQLLGDEPVYREALEDCDRRLRDIAPWSLLEALTADEQRSRVGDADRAQVVNLAVQLALAALWRSWGVVPDAVVGHSAGELAAACTAGVLGLDDALQVAYHRGRLQHRASGTGTMLAAGIGPDDAQPLLDGRDDVALAAINSPASVTLSGSRDALDGIAARLEADERFWRFLPVEVPYHGPQMDAIRDELHEALAGVTPRDGTVPLVSVVTGDWIDGRELDAGYWWRNVRQPVQFAGAMDTLAAAGHELFLEVGPHPVLGVSIQQCLAAVHRDGTVLHSLRREEDERAALLATLAELHVRGRPVAWSALYPDRSRFVSLPTYPWQRERHWLETVDDAAATRTAGRDTGHPLLGRRLRSARACWEADLGASRLGYLDDHHVGGSVTFPGAASVEIALAAATELTEEGPTAVEQVTFRSLVFLEPRDGVAVQCLHDPERATLEIHEANRDDDAWTLTASARIGRGRPAGRADLAVLRERCAASRPLDEHFRALEAHGFGYGPAFRGITALRAGADEALARIEAPTGVSTDAYLVHPALLDAAFQVLLAGTSAPDGRSDAQLLPLSIGRVDLIRRPGPRFWAHARLTRLDDEAVEGVLQLLDDDGDVLVACEGLRLEVIDRRRPTATRSPLYALRWEAAETDPPAADIDLPALETRDLVAPTRAALGDERGWGAFYEETEAGLDEMAALYVHAALHDLGWDGGEHADAPGQLADALGVAPAHHRYLDRLFQIVEAVHGSDRGADAEEARSRARSIADRLAAAHPAERAPVDLVRFSGEQLAATLRGSRDAREALFTDAARDALTAFYRDSGPIHQGNIALAGAVAAASERHAGRPLRVLEIGAGTGGTTAHVLPMLPPEAEYVFTDVSPYFLPSAQERFGARERTRFERLDIEADPDAAERFDIVVAPLVLHATADLRAALGHVRRLLRPGGLLALLEVTRQMPWVDLVFGALDGWWRFRDTDLRPGHPLLDVEQWQRLLDETGFAASACVEVPVGSPEPRQAVLLATEPEEAAPAKDAAGRRWLLLADRRGIADTLAEALRAAGDDCTLVRPDGSVRIGADEVTLRPERVDDWVRLLEEADGDGPGIVHLWSLDAPPAAVLTAEALLDHQERSCAGVAALGQALQRAGAEAELWIVTAGAQPVDGAAVEVAQSALWGLGRVLMNEHAELRCRLVDLGPSCADAEVVRLASELRADPEEREIAFRGGDRFVTALHELDVDGGDEAGAVRRLAPDEAAFTLEIGEPGALDTLRLRERPPPAPGPGEVAIRVRANALNFRDVLNAMGMLELPHGEATVHTAALGGDCAGVVLACGPGVDHVQPGDEVISLTPGAFGSQVTALAPLVVPKPATLGWGEAAALPTAFLTARYALGHAARLAPGERVLIHAATGGVGLAAVAVAQQVGAEVFATAGSEEKREHLRGLGVEHVMDSRSLRFADEILVRTGGEGVDVVLNSLAGDALLAGLEVLRPYGRFVELGKRDIYGDTRIGLLPFRRNLTFVAFDLFQLCADRTELAGSLLRDTVAQVADGTLAPLPVTAFDLAEAEAAIRFMAQARHIGKVALTQDEPSYPVHPRLDAPLLRQDGTYLITGGLGGFGLAVAGWMAQQGAGHLVLMSRRGVPEPEDAAALAALQDSPAHVHVLRGDVTLEEDVARVLEHVATTMPTLRGVVHAAMVLDDAAVDELDRARFRAVLAPKVAGAWNLHRLTAEDDLDLFVSFSSLASVLGTLMQGNYAAANAFLDAFAPFRRARGQPALTVNWGAIAAVGYVARHPKIWRFLEREGLQAMSPEEALDVLDRLLRHDQPNAIALRVDWDVWRDPASAVGRYAASRASARTPAEQAGGVTSRLLDAPPEDRLALLEDHLAQMAAKVLGTSAAKLDLDRPLPALGFDSLMAVELQTALKLELGVQVGVTKLLKDASLREVTPLVLDRLGPGTTDGSPAPSAAAGPAAEAPTDAPAPPSGDAPIHHPLSYEQQRFWLADQLDPGDPRANLHLAVRLTGALDTAALERSLSALLDRNESLRTRITTVDGEPVQTFPPAGPAPLPVADLRDHPANRREDALRRLAAEEIQRPFDLAEGPLLRARLYRLGDTEHVLVATTHHIAFNPWSTAVLGTELITLYAAERAGTRAALAPPPARYTDYVAWQQAHLDDELVATQTAYWRAQLDGARPAVPMPADRPEPEIPTHRGGHVRFALGAPVEAALADLARDEGVTPFMVLLAAFQTLLHRYTGEHDISVGTPVAPRGFPHRDQVIGCCINTLVMRTDLGGDPTFRQLLRRVQQVALDAYEHQDLPFQHVADAVDAAGHRLFNTMLVLHADPELPGVDMPGLAFAPAEVESGLALFDLMLVFDPGPQLRGTLEYRSDLFDRPTAARIVDHLRRLLEAAVTMPDQPVSELPLLSDAEADQATGAWNDTDVDLGPARCLHELVEEQAARTPDRVAISGDAGTLTYAELDRRAAQVAQRLADLGVVAGDVVGVCAAAASDTVVGILGVLKAGAAYLALDPADPPARLRTLVDDVDAGVVLTGERTGPQPRDLPGRRVATLEEAQRSRSARPRHPTAVAPDALAYVLPTSGSTGRPKCVAVSHAAIVNQVRWRQRAFPLAEDEAVLLRSPLTFDPSVWEIFGPLAAGARLVVPGAGRDSAGLVALVAEQDVTTLQVVPSVLEALVDEPGLAGCRSLRRVFCGGEPLPAALAERLVAAVPVDLHHLYGPAEATIDATCWTYQRGAPDAIVPIGRPIANTRVYVCDEHLRPVPAGVTGELCIQGAGLARGYIGQAELTAERFVPSPFGSAPGDRLYRSGDLGRWRPDGTLEFLGRRDEQVKVRGFRIEPAEVEAALRSLPDVRDAAVAARGTGARRRLVAFVVPEDGRSVGPSVPQQAGARLPAHLVPSELVEVEALPRTSTGKVARSQLAAEPLPIERARPTVAPRDAVEQALVDIWEQLLGCPVGVTDDFFALGGTSLLAARLMARIHQVLGAALPLATLAEHRTIAQLAGVLGQRQAPAPPVVALQPRGSARPLFLVPGVGGGIVDYVPLANSLDGDRPLYALQAGGSRDGEADTPAEVRLEDLAAHHLEAIRGVQPEGPYLLAGWSMGGLVAFEMARQASAQGEDVALLAVLDAWPAGPDGDDERLLRRHLRNVGAPSDGLPLTPEQFWALAGAAQLDWLVAHAGAAGLELPGEPPEASRRRLGLLLTHLRALHRYHPAPYAGRIVLLAAEQGEESPANATARWEPIARGGVTLARVPGDHYTMLRPPHVARLAHELAGRLAEADLVGA